MIKKSYSNRRYVIIFIISVIGLIFLIKLFTLQVLDNNYKLFAENNVLRYITQYPGRGLVYDRNGQLLVYNEAAYDLLVVPRQIKDINTSVFCSLLHIDEEEYKKRLDRAKAYSWYKPSVFIEQISKEDYAYLEERLFKFPGFYVQSRTLRKYPMPVAAHILGYVGEVDRNDLEKDSYYTQGDYIGKSGIEKAYENLLRGEKGMKVVMVDVFNREKGSFQDGKFDTAAVSGRNLYLTIDAELQQYGEKLMQNKMGSIVAIEPSSGEILAMVSNPSYDPNLLIGRVRTRNFKRLSQDTLKPLFNRATSAQYPPGSTFKPVNALIGLNENVISKHSRFSCNGPGTNPIGCSHNHYSPLDLPQAIEQSCNPYFWNVYREIIEQDKFISIQEGYNTWRDYLLSFNIGRAFESDIIMQRKGNLPPDSYFNRYYGENGWRAITIRSLSIGQGEIELTPLQLANATAIIANRGHYYTPHLLKSVDTPENPFTRYNIRNEGKIAPENYEPVIEGMQLVYEGEHGSSRWYKIKDIEMCGKTGTAENPHGDDHSLFVAFAPKDNPRIAIAVVVENSGYGATWAAPIASLLIEKYLKGEVEQNWYEQKMLNTDLINKESETKKRDIL